MDESGRIYMDEREEIPAEDRARFEEARRQAQESGDPAQMEELRNQMREAQGSYIDLKGDNVQDGDR